MKKRSPNKEKKRWTARGNHTSGLRMAYARVDQKWWNPSTAKPALKRISHLIHHQQSLFVSLTTTFHSQWKWVGGP